MTLNDYYSQSLPPELLRREPTPIASASAPKPRGRPKKTITVDEEASDG